MRTMQGQPQKRHSAVPEWIALRASAVALVALFAWLVWFIAQAVQIGADHAAFVALLAQPGNAAAMAALVALACLHGALGGREILEDYIHHPAVKRASMAALALTMGALALAGVGAVGFVALR